MEASSIPLFVDEAKPVTLQSQRTGIGAIRTELVLPPPYQRHENSNPDSLRIAAKMAGIVALVFITMVGYLALR